MNARDPLQAIPGVGPRMAADLLKWWSWKDGGPGRAGGRAAEER